MSKNDGKDDGFEPATLFKLAHMITDPLATQARTTKLAVVGN